MKIPLNGGVENNMDIMMEEITHPRKYISKEENIISSKSAFNNR